MALDECAPMQDDADGPRPSGSKGLTPVSSSIGPGGSAWPPSIRPAEASSDAEDAEARESMSMDRTPIEPKTDEPASPADLREHLKLGARMISALESQLLRATRLLRDQQDASQALDRRLSAMASLDVRVEEIEAAVATLERRVDHAIEGDASPHRSGSLSLPGLEDSNAGPGNDVPAEGGEIRETLRLEVDAVRRLTGTLAELVERATRTETSLREALAAAGNDEPDSKTPEWTVASVLRRLADEIDVESAGTTETENVVVEVDATNETISKPTSGPRPVES